MFSGLLSSVYHISFLSQQTDFEKDNLRDLLYGLLQMLLQNREPELRHVKTADRVLAMFAQHVQNNLVEVDTEVRSKILMGVVCLPAGGGVSEQLIEVRLLVDIRSGARGGGHLDLMAPGHSQGLLLQVRV